MLGYNGVKRLAKEHPDWLPIVEASFECAKQYKEFAGSWVLDDAKRRGVSWFPGLRLLTKYGILKHEDTTRGGRRAYYTMPDPKGVEKALLELGLLNKTGRGNLPVSQAIMSTKIWEELEHIPDWPEPQGFLRVMYQGMRMHNLSRKVEKKKSAKEVLEECIAYLQKDYLSFEFRYDKEFFK